MNYSWDIREWIERFDWRLKAMAVHIAWIYALLKPIKDKHDELLLVNADIDLKVRYNSQQKVFAALLNKLFDDTLQRIRVVTGIDSHTPYYIYSVADGATPRFLYSEADAGEPATYLYPKPSGAVASFKVYAPASLAADETRLKAWIDYYKLADKTYVIIYE